MTLLHLHKSVQTCKIQIKKQHAAKPSGKRNWKEILRLLNFPYLNGWHLCDLFDVLQREGDVPQRCLVGQLHGPCKQGQKVELIEKIEPTS